MIVVKASQLRTREALQFSSHSSVCPKSALPLKPLPLAEDKAAVSSRIFSFHSEFESWRRERQMRMPIIGIALGVFATLGTVPAALAQSSANSTLFVSPRVIQPISGKLPASMLIDVGLTNCTPESDISKDSIALFGSGLSITGAKPGKCDIPATLEIDPSTSPGNFDIILVDSQGVPVSNGRTSIAILDTNAGAIPPGLAPEIDVMWAVLSQEVCNDVFGRRVASYFYCIEVKIGNNSGHPLQLAGIGFSQHPEQLEQAGTIANSSYASTRAVLLREEVLSPRNEFYHSIQAAGLIMSGLIPYFHAPNSAAHYSTAASIVAGPLLQAVDIIAPDRVVGQLNNLDDESFRDSQIIPNNTQIRTTVFVDKRSLTDLLNALSQKPGEPGDCSSNGAGKNCSQKEIAATAQNSEQKAPFRLKLFFRSADFSPYQVKRALGDLILVGNAIEYLQRVQVQSSSMGGGSSISVSPSQVNFGNIQSGVPAAAQTITLTNAGTSPISGITIAVSGSGKSAFSENSTCSTNLAAGSSCIVSVSAIPVTDGTFAGTISIATNSGNTQNVSLSATAYGTGLTFNPNATNFGTLAVGSSSKAPTGVITVTNRMAQSISGGFGVSIGGDDSADFAYTTTCPGPGAGPLAPGGTCTISIVFTPHSQGTRSGTMQITYVVGTTKLTTAIGLSGIGQ